MSDLYNRLTSDDAATAIEYAAVLSAIAVTVFAVISGIGVILASTTSTIDLALMSDTPPVVTLSAPAQESQPSPAQARSGR